MKKRIIASKVLLCVVLAPGLVVAETPLTSTIEATESASSYSRQPGVLNLIDNLPKRGRSPRTGASYKGRCYRAVKDAMYDAGMAELGSLNQGRARDAARDLAPQGYINLLSTCPGLQNKDITEFPDGVILVYRGGPSGHIEVKTNRGYCYYVNRRTNICPQKPISKITKKRTLTGIWVHADLWPRTANGVLCEI